MSYEGEDTAVPVLELDQTEQDKQDDAILGLIVSGGA